MPSHTQHKCFPRTFPLTLTLYRFCYSSTCKQSITKHHQYSLNHYQCSHSLNISISINALTSHISHLTQHNIINTHSIIINALTHSLSISINALTSHILHNITSSILTQSLSMLSLTQHQHQHQCSHISHNTINTLIHSFIHSTSSMLSMLTNINTHILLLRLLPRNLSTSQHHEHLIFHI